MEEKIPLLITLLRDRDPTRTMVFVNTRREAEKLSDALQRNGIEAEALSGDVPQTQAPADAARTFRTASSRC